MAINNVRWEKPKPPLEIPTTPRTFTGSAVVAWDATSSISEVLTGLSSEQVLYIDVQASPYNPSPCQIKFFVTNKAGATSEAQVTLAPGGSYRLESPILNAEDPYATLFTLTDLVIMTASLTPSPNTQYVAEFIGAELPAA